VSALHRRLQEYLAVRRAMGFKMERHEKVLTQFATTSQNTAPPR
jgi:hypothetical protein